MTGSYVARILRNKIDIWKNIFYLAFKTDRVFAVFLIEQSSCCHSHWAGQGRRWKSWASLGTPGLATQGRAALVCKYLSANQIIWVGDCSGHIPFSGPWMATIQRMQQICASRGSQGKEDSHKSSLAYLTVFCLELQMSCGGKPIILLQSFRKRWLKLLKNIMLELELTINFNNHKHMVCLFPDEEINQKKNHGWLESHLNISLYKMSSICVKFYGQDPLANYLKNTYTYKCKYSEQRDSVLD